MAITAWPFETNDTTEVQFSRLMDALQESGVVNGLTVTAGAGLSVNIAAGAALVKGLYIEVTGTENRTLNAAPVAGQTRLDYLLLKRDYTANTATIVVKAGTANTSGGVLPALQQDDAIFEQPLAVITVPGGASSLVSGNISERRATLSRGWLVYRSTPDERPTPSRVSFGINITTKQIELYNGSAWEPLTIAWANVSGKPSTFAPIIGSGATQAVAGNDPRLTNERTATPHDINGDRHTGTLTVAKGGTGATDAAGARSNLGALGGVVQTAATADPTTGNYVGRLLIEY